MGLNVLQKGDEVKIRGQECIGEIVELTSKYAKVAFQFVAVSIPLSKLEKASITSQTASFDVLARSATRILNRKSYAFSSFNAEIDLHGMSVSEAVNTVDLWIDRALLLGHQFLKIIHGKGSGALRSAIRSHLQSHSHARRVTNRYPDKGEDGVTWLEIV